VNAPRAASPNSLGLAPVRCLAGQLGLASRAVLDGGSAEAQVGLVDLDAPLGLLQLPGHRPALWTRPRAALPGQPGLAFTLRLKALQKPEPSRSRRPVPYRVARDGREEALGHYRRGSARRRPDGV